MNPADSQENGSTKASGEVQAALAAIEQLVGRRSQVRTAGELQRLEAEIITATDQLASAILAQKLQAALDEPEMQVAARDFIKQAPKKLKNQGRRRVEVRASRGPAFEVETSYYSPNHTGSRKKK
jgi:hypothetical protein